MAWLRPELRDHGLRDFRGDEFLPLRPSPILHQGEAKIDRGESNVRTSTNPTARRRKTLKLKQSWRKSSLRRADMKPLCLARSVEAPLTDEALGEAMRPVDHAEGVESLRLLSPPRSYGNE